jgi:hypothetical protein
MAESAKGEDEKGISGWTLISVLPEIRDSRKELAAGRVQQAAQVVVFTYI